MSDHRTLGVLLGAALVVGALFAPWYALDLGPEMRGMMNAQTTRLPGELGQFARDLLSVAPDRIVADGWQAFERTDIVLLCMSIGAVVAAALDRMDVAGGAGAVSVGATMLAMVDQPQPSELISLQWGAWLALGGGLMIIVASHLSVPRPGPSAQPDLSWAMPVTFPSELGDPTTSAGRPPAK